jgi:hypothetical protein
MNPTLSFQDQADLSDLTAYLTRAKKLDSEGAVKLRSFGELLAVYVSPIFSGSLIGDGPTVLGLRTLKLKEAAELDGTFEISAILERIANLSDGNLSLSVPPTQVRVAWSGVIPPRQGWEQVGTIEQAQITTWAKEGIAEVAQALPESVGSSIAAKVRLQIWGRPVDLELGLPAASAFAMAGLGFMQPQENVKVFSSNNWLRLSSNHGHVLAKRSPTL